MMNQFYLLEGYSEQAYPYAYEDTSLLGRKIQICETCGRQVSSWSFSGAHQLLLEGSGDYPDRLMFCGAGGPLFILSATAAQTFDKNGISGISQTSPIETIHDQAVPPRYVLAQISGTIDLDFKKMGLKKKRQCTSCGSFEWNRQRMYPLYVNEETWDGSDICRVSSIPGYIICTDRVASLVKDQKLSGFCFNPL